MDKYNDANFKGELISYRFPQFIFATFNILNVLILDLMNFELFGIAPETTKEIDPATRAFETDIYFVVSVIIGMLAAVVSMFLEEVEVPEIELQFKNAFFFE